MKLPKIKTLNHQIDVIEANSTATEARLARVETDWREWRGPTHDGIAAPGQQPPLHWSATENVAWKPDMTGRS